MEPGPKVAIHHHGGVEGVTGSCHELDGPEGSVLVDCGLFQGADLATSRSDGGLTIDFNVDQVRALVLTHCHLDHVGRVPYLFAAGFRGPIYCSEATAQLLPLVIEDALEIGFTRDRRLIERFLDLLKQQTVSVPYGRWTAVTDTGMSLRLQPAGHILGSAYVEFDLPTDGKAATMHRGKRVVFSGDLGAPHSPLLPAPKPPNRADVLVLESTYGDRRHEGRRSRRERLQSVVERCLENRGVVLIPAFSIGRTQELLYELEETIHCCGDRAATRDLPWRDMEIVVDSPLAARFTREYRSLKHFWDAEARQRVASGRHPLAFEQLTTIGNHDDHLRAVDYLRKSGRPTVVIAASGMCTGGRIMNYLKGLLGDAGTDVLFVGYQAEGTPGREIQRYGPSHGWVQLDGQKYAIRAGVHTLGGYSAHADQKNLVDFVTRIRKGPVEVRLVHGEPCARESLAEVLRERLPDTRVVLPGNEHKEALV